jgi:hypothetical protein
LAKVYQDTWLWDLFPLLVSLRPFWEQKLVLFRGKLTVARVPQLLIEIRKLSIVTAAFDRGDNRFNGWLDLPLGLQRAG